MTRIKICGLRTPADIAAANESRPDYIGFILSPAIAAKITKEQALALRKRWTRALCRWGCLSTRRRHTCKPA